MRDSLEKLKKDKLAFINIDVMFDINHLVFELIRSHFYKLYSIQLPNEFIKEMELLPLRKGIKNITRKAVKIIEETKIKLKWDDRYNSKEAEFHYEKVHEELLKNLKVLKP